MHVRNAFYRQFKKAPVKDLHDFNHRFPAALLLLLIPIQLLSLFQVFCYSLNKDIMNGEQNQTGRAEGFGFIGNRKGHTSSSSFTSMEKAQCSIHVVHNTSIKKNKKIQNFTAQSWAVWCVGLQRCRKWLLLYSVLPRQPSPPPWEKGIFLPFPQVKREAPQWDYLILLWPKGWCWM